MGRYASNPDLSFTWYDAAILSQKIRQESQECEPSSRFDLPPDPPITTNSLSGRPCTPPLHVFSSILRVERNASDLTVKSYREDLTALANYMAEAHGGQCPDPGLFSVLELRGYVTALHEAGYAKTTIARRLASLRSFFRFGQREGWAKNNPAKPLRNPRKGRTLPHFLSAEDIGRLLWAPPPTNPWACATARSSRRSTRPGCG